MARQTKRRPYRRGIDTAIALLKMLGRKDGPSRIGEITATLGIPHASIYRIIRTLSEHGVLATVRPGWVVPGPTCAGLAVQFEACARREDERIAGREARPPTDGAVAYGLLRNAGTCVITPGRSYRRSPKYRIGFANAALDNLWRTALVHAVESGASRRTDLVASLAVRHAARDVARQASDIDTLVSEGVDGLVVSAVDGEALGSAIARAAERGVPTILVDRGSAVPGRHVSLVACDNWMIGRTMARWLAEHIGGKGGVVMLGGDSRAEPARQRSEGAQSAFADFPEISVIGQHWTNWQRERGHEAMLAALAEHGAAIAGVWCDSGLQAAGSLAACAEASGRQAIPPHTGGDLNLTYKLAIRHGVALGAVNYPPAMGLRAVDVLLDVLRGRSVPERLHIPTEVVLTRGHATGSVRPDVWADQHVRWDLPDELILAAGLGPAYNPRAFRVRYGGNRYNRSAAAPEVLDVA